MLDDVVRESAACAVACIEEKIIKTDAFPRQFAQTQRFSLGLPRQVTVSADGARVLFVRSVSGIDPRGLLWVFENGEERVLVDPAALESDAQTQADQPTRPGRSSANATGLGAYATDREARVVVFTVGGVLWTVRTDGGTPHRLTTPGPVADPVPSPDGSLIAYVSGGALRVVRTDGSKDLPLAEPESCEVTYGRPPNGLGASVPMIARGSSPAYWWSPDSDALLVTRVDASKVDRWYVADPARPDRTPRSIPYPAAGMTNPDLSLHVFGVEGAHTTVRLPDAAPDDDAPQEAWSARDFEYLATAGWGPVGPVVTLQTRDQRTLWHLVVDPTTGDCTPVSRQSDERWVELSPGAPLHTTSGVLVRSAQIADTRAILIGDTPSPDGLEVREVLGSVDEQIYFTASQDPTEIHVWSYHPERGFVRLTDEPGVHTATFGGDTLVLESTTLGGHTVTVLQGGKPAGEIAVLVEEPLVSWRSVHLVLGQRELRSRLHLPSWHTEESGPLPVLLMPYAGPRLQTVTMMNGPRSAVSQWYADQGFAVLLTDGRGTPGRGVRWEQAIMGDRLAPVLEDQIDALHAAAERHDALDLDRVGIRGWSYGGYVAAGAVLHHPEVFHAAVAGAPLTDWRLYGPFGAERFLGHPDVAPGDYDRSSLVPHAHKLTRPLMLIHSLADTNVLPAHTLRLSAALLAAARPHTVLPMSGVGHVPRQEGVADTLLQLELDFLRSSLGGWPVR